MSLFIFNINIKDNKMKTIFCIISQMLRWVILDENNLDRLYKYICLELKNQRKNKKNKVTQGDVASHLGIDISYISRIENGKKNRVALNTFLAIAEYYGVSMHIIIKNAEKRMKEDDSNKSSEI